MKIKLSYLLILYIFPVIRFSDPEAAILTQKMLFWHWKCLEEAAFLRIFPAANERSAPENIDQGGSEKGFSKHFKISK